MVLSRFHLSRGISPSLRWKPWNSSIPAFFLHRPGHKLAPRCEGVCRVTQKRREHGLQSHTVPVTYLERPVSKPPTLAVWISLWERNPQPTNNDGTLWDFNLGGYGCICSDHKPAILIGSMQSRRLEIKAMLLDIPLNNHASASIFPPTSTPCRTFSQSTNEPVNQPRIEQWDQKPIYISHVLGSLLAVRSVPVPRYTSTSTYPQGAYGYNHDQLYQCRQSELDTATGYQLAEPFYVGLPYGLNQPLQVNTH